MRGLISLKSVFTFITCLLVQGASAFVPSFRYDTLGLSTMQRHPFKNQGTSYIEQQYPNTIQKQRQSMTSVTTMNLFGLGAPELAIILIAGAFLLGPQKIAELGKDAGKIAGELKEVPKEFQKGFEEGDENVKAKNAKQMDEPSKE